MKSEPSISTIEAAEVLGVGAAEVYRMIDEGRLTASWDGKRLVVPVSQIQSLAGSAR